MKNTIVSLFIIAATISCSAIRESTIKVKGRIESIEIESNLSFNQEEKISDLLQVEDNDLTQSGSLFLHRGGIQSLMSLEAGEVGSIKVRFNGSGNQNSKSIEFQRHDKDVFHGIIGELEKQIE
jgi:hypothetical protein